MEELLEYVSEEKREEFKKKAADYVKLNDDIAYEYVNRSQSLRDKVATPIVEARFKNFKERELTELLNSAKKEGRDLAMKELKPEETPEQKKLRELEENIRQRDLRDAQEAKKAALRKKAAELQYDPLLAERLYALEDADDVLAKLAEMSKADKEKLAALEKKIKFGDKAPPAGGSGTAISEADFLAMNPKERAAFLAKGGRIE